MKTRILYCFIIAIFVMFGGQPLNAADRGARIGKKVNFTTGDGIVISGLFYPPSSKQKKTFILLHGLASNQEEWQTFAHALIRSGNGFLSYDARGHGESTTDKNGKKISYEYFSPPGEASEWSKMSDDLAEAVKFLKAEKNIEKRNIGLAGASLGANVCLIYASTETAIPLIILLSPGLNYAGLAVSNSIKAFTKRSIAIAASPLDTYSYQSSNLLYKQIESNKKASMLLGTGGKHGVQMFEDKQFMKKLMGWISRH